MVLGVSRFIYISGLLTMPKPLTVWITINCVILKEMEISEHLICLLRNLYAGQEATVRTGHGTTDWFQIGKGERQGYVLSPCLFNFYAEYIMRNARLEECTIKSCDPHIKISPSIKTLRAEKTHPPLRPPLPSLGAA